MAELTDQELERYARHIVLPQVGGLGQRRLKAASVAIVGAGGIGSAAMPALAGAGVGRLTIIDDDVIDRPNLQRQTIFRDDQVGQAKAAVAADYVRALNPDVIADPVETRLDAGNAEALLSRHDLILDGCDNFATRLVVGDLATRLRIPLVSAAAIQFQGQVALFRGWEADKPCYRCFVGDAFDSEDCDNCADLGVLGALTGTVGSFAALMAIRVLAGIGSDAAASLFLFDGAALEWRKIRLPKDPNCSACNLPRNGEGDRRA